MKISLKTKLSAAFVAVTVCGIAFAGFLVDRSVRAAMLTAYEDRLSYQTTMFGQMTANALFGEIDPADTSLRDSVKALGAAVHTRLALLAKDGTVVADSESDDLHVAGASQTAPEIAAAASNADSKSAVAIRDGRMWVAAAVVRDGATLGFARTSVPMSEVQAYVTAVRLRVGIGCLAALVVATALGLFFSAGIVRPVRALSVGVKRVGQGDYSHTIEVATTDEVGELARSFNDMTRSLRETVARLDARNRDMRLVLDNVDQGLMMVDVAGTLSAERSAVVDRWFGPIGAREQFVDVLARADAGTAETFALQFEELIEGELPRKLLLHQLPKQLKHGDRDFEIAYRPIADADDRLINLLVVLSDVTAKLAAQRSEAEQREIATVFERILRDKSGVIEFLLDADATVRELTAEERLPLHEIKRKLHTLKGNAAVYGMQSLSTQCHGIETRMEDAAGDMSPADQKALSVTWTRTAELLRNLLGDRKQGIVVDDEEYATVLRALLEGASRSEVFRQIREWSMERASDRLERFANQARDLGRRLRKGDVRVDVDGGGLRLPREEWAPFWTAFTHAVRNAVDHGLESPADRVAKGKPEQGRIRLSAGRAGREVLIELADDGKGIDWERVAERARAAGLPCQRESDLVAAVFADGLSTRTAVSEVSGRGVGLGALKQACERLGGYVTLQSARDEGTTFRFHMPIPERGQSLHPPESLRPKTVPTIAGPS